MDPNQCNDASQGSFPATNFPPGANNPPYPAGWNPYMYGLQGTPSWFPQRMQQFAPNGSMMHPCTSGPQVLQSADNPQPSVQDEEVHVIEQPPSEAAKGKGKRTKVVTSMIKLGNFNPDEDVNLVKSWLEISCDPITSTGQKKDRMWEKIVERYNSRRESNPVRSIRSLQSRWDSIKAEVGKFSGFYADAIREGKHLLLHTIGFMTKTPTFGYYVISSSTSG